MPSASPARARPARSPLAPTAEPRTVALDRPLGREPLTSLKTAGLLAQRALVVVGPHGPVWAGAEARAAPAANRRADCRLFEPVC